MPVALPWSYIIIQCLVQVYIPFFGAAEETIMALLSFVIY